MDVEDGDNGEGEEQKYQGDKVLPWTNPFTPGKSQKTFSGLDFEKSEDEQLQDELGMALSFFEASDSLLFLNFNKTQNDHNKLITASSPKMYIMLISPY